MTLESDTLALEEGHPEFTSQLCSERAVKLGKLRDTPEPQFTHLCTAHKGIIGLNESNKVRLYV